MWCGGCYSSSQEVLFHVKRRAVDAEDNENDPQHQQRMTGAWGKKQRDVKDFLVARDGDHLMVPFECDLCVFRKLRGISPTPSNPVDNLLLACIRRVILDAFWSRSRSTVEANGDKVAFAIKLLETVGLVGPYKAHGHLPEFDHCGYKVAIEMVLHSRRSGHYSQDYVQFETIRKLRSSFSNHCRASAQLNQSSLSLGDQKGRYQRFSTDPCSSFWFYHFVEGARLRMGQDWRPNKAISVDLLLLVLEAADLKVREATSPREMDRWVVFHTYVVICYVLSLRGCEGFLCDLSGLHRKFASGGTRYVVVALLGKIKGESGDRAHLFPCVLVTSSGIEVKASIERLMNLKASQGFVTGPAISDMRGRILSHRSLNDSLLEILDDLFDSHRELFPASISDRETLRKRVQVYRTLRRTSNTRAIDKKVPKSDIDVVNRWKSLERADGNRPHRPMRQHYAELELLFGPFLRYTWAM